jgi:hypothetical protein
MSHTITIRNTGTHNTAATPVDGKFPVEVIRKRLSVDEVYPANQRLGGTPLRVQYTPDGGATWVDAPNLDPRNASNPPARTGVTDNCPAASSVTEYVHRFMTIVLGVLSAGSTVVQGTGALLVALDLLGGYGILWDIVAGVFGTLTGFGASAIAAAFTSDQYDDLTCILFCNMANSQVTADGLVAIKTQVSATLNATAGLIVNLILDLMGVQGINKAALFYTTGHSCSGCPSCDWDFSIDLTWLWGQSSRANSPNPGCPPNLSYGPQGALSSWAGHPTWVCEKTLGDTANRFGRTFPIIIPAGATMTAILMSWVRSTGNTDQFTKILWPFNLGPYCVSGAFHNSPLGYGFAPMTPQTVQVYAGIGTTVASDSTSLHIVQMRIVGTGTRPAIPYVPTIYA